LWLLSPAIGELLSGPSPPLEFFNPFSYLLLASLYCSGAVLIRELKNRWDLDFKGLLLLGAVFVLRAASYMNRIDWSLPESATNRLSIISGGLAFMILLAFLMEFRGITGMFVVCFFAVALLMLLRFKIKKSIGSV
jgi:hypothetical protein